jgi:hypothetical protein
MTSVSIVRQRDPMARPLRIVLFTFLLLPPVATAVVWIGHVPLTIGITGNPSGPHYRFALLKDYVFFSRDTHHPPIPVTSWPIANPDIHITILGVGYDYEYWEFGGHEIGGTYYPRGSYVRDITLRYWFLLILTAIPPAWLLLRRWRSEPGTGLCAVCRYDLRAHKPGDKCPECGTMVPDAPIHTKIPPGA